MLDSHLFASRLEVNKEQRISVEVHDLNFLNPT